MDHKPLLVGLLLLILAIVGSYFLATGTVVAPTGDEAETLTETDGTGGAAQTDGSGKTTSPKAAPVPSTSSKKLPSYTCDFDAIGKTAGINTRLKGTISSASGKTRLETFTEVGNTIVETFSLESGGAVYTWKIGATTGTKTFGPLDTSIVPSLEGSGSVVRDGMTINWNCHPWIAEEKYLVLPKGITFTTR